MRKNQHHIKCEQNCLANGTEIKLTAKCPHIEQTHWLFQLGRSEADIKDTCYIDTAFTTVVAASNHMKQKTFQK